ncbi:MAG TPA: DUF4333 domain-containing protein [Candidatus Acidoferrales bacterium]|jgi:hypothetical protein|nr:DUF4333 domain-containing protein [Candidatus Acidoferrales bacterium]
MKGVRLILQAMALLPIAFAAGTLHASAQQSESVASIVEKFIDAEFVPLLRQYDPKLAVGEAACPSAEDFSNGKTVYCTLPVGAVPLQVGLTYSDEKKTYEFVPASFFEMDRLEFLEQASILGDYGVKAEVKCGDPRFRLLAIGTIFTCALSGVPTATTVRFRSEANGQYFVYNPDGMKSPAWLTTALDEHKAGKPTILDGATVGTWIQHILEAAVLMSGGSQTPIVVQCPPSLDVTGSNRAICIVTFRGKDVRREVFVDPIKGVDTRSLDAVINLHEVGMTIAGQMDERLKDGGKTPDAVLRCGTGLLVVAPKGTFQCDGTANGRPFRIEVTVTDVKGAFEYKVVDDK